MPLPHWLLCRVEGDVVHGAKASASAAMCAFVTLGMKFSVTHGMTQEIGPNDVRFHSFPCTGDHINGFAPFGNILRNLFNARRGSLQFFETDRFDVHIKPLHADIVVGHLHRVGGIKMPRLALHRLLENANTASHIIATGGDHESECAFRISRHFKPLNEVEHNGGWPPGVGGEHEAESLHWLQCVMEML